jgi:hypothetical protein
MTNDGELMTWFEWKVDGPFVITPSSGHLHVGDSIEVTVKFAATV